jgi:uncharacterized protein YprB with RNaseH-like and TPR domain
VDIPGGIPVTIEAPLSILVPDLIPLFYGDGPPCAGIPSKRLLFFDLETTGLSAAGSGTIAFLAALGRPVTPCNGAAGGLRVTQYLLLDFPGEADFLTNTLREFSFCDQDDSPVTVSYNGKAFDGQLLKTRCLMNGFEPPFLQHCDLLHPSRRLWKHTLPDCSQGTVESLLPGLEGARDGDLSGAFAPEMWFRFLREGDTEGLLAVCDHNIRDLRGLAGILAALCRVADAPLEAGAALHCRTEALALRFREALFRGFAASGTQDAAEALLHRAAEEGAPRACRILAIRAERVLQDPAQALDWTRRALAGPAPLSGGLREEFLHRQERLVRKTLLTR